MMLDLWRSVALKLSNATFLFLSQTHTRCLPLLILCLNLLCQMRSITVSVKCHVAHACDRGREIQQAPIYILLREIARSNLLTLLGVINRITDKSCKLSPCSGMLKTHNTSVELSVCIYILCAKHKDGLKDVYLFSTRFHFLEYGGLSKQCLLLKTTQLLEYEVNNVYQWKWHTCFTKVKKENVGWRFYYG